MIEKIDTITKFGIYKDLAFSAPDFKKYNLIYGWNYSGKTTLSRLFRCIELEKLHLDFPDAKFELTDNEKSKIKHNQLDGSTYQFRVFNTDFVNNNLYWDNQEANPIFVLGEEDIEIQKQMEILNRTINELEDEKIKLTKEKSRRTNNIEKELTKKARDISRIKSPYNKANLKKILEKYHASLDEYRLDEKALSILHETINTPSKEVLSYVSFKILNQKRVEEIKELLDKTVLSQTIEKFKNNSELNNWVQKGLVLHKRKQQCEFCGNPLTSELISTYENHFSKEYENMLTELNQQVQSLNECKISIHTPDNKRLYPQLEEEYKIVKSKLYKFIYKYNEIIENIIILLNKKISNPFNKYAENFSFVDVNIINEILKEFNQLIRTHNDICDNFENEQSEAFEKLELHYACEFDNDNNYYGIIDELKQLDIKIDPINDEIAKNKELVHQMGSKLSNIGKAAKKINGELQSIFGNDHVKLEAVENNKFKILREGREAKNLSEGEKTAIAFSYFLTCLEDKKTDISKAIIFIDDPISSLDSNHLYNTFAVIKTKLEDCNQLFVSTHNFEFFNLMKDWFTKIKGNKSKCSYYLIERIIKDGNEASDICELPSFLLKYKSEYHYLFSKIKSFDDNPRIDFESLYQLPNITRRFLEAFFGFKYSVGIKDGLKLLIINESDQIKIDKFVNNFSHQRVLSRSLALADITEYRNVVHIILDAVQIKDPEHYASLDKIYTDSII